MLAAITAMVMLAAIVVMAFMPVIQELQRRKEDLLRSERRLAASLEEERRLTHEIELIKSSPAYVEHLARQRLNMGKPGEVIYYFEPYKVPTPAPASGTTSGAIGTPVPASGSSSGAPAASTSSGPSVRAP